mgnify:CR=1 FL=1
MLERGLAETRQKAQALILAGHVLVNDQKVEKGGALVGLDARVRLLGEPLKYVSRGGLKLAHALDSFNLPVKGMVALDVGASTGGFTDCLLQRGAERVYALDVGHGQLHYKLRQDPRVVSIEKCNARFPFELPEQVDLVTIDVSFISVTLVVPPALEHLKAGCHLIVLVKPQFEARRGEVGQSGVVKAPRIHAATLGRAIVWAVGHGLRLRNLCPSPILGDAGNREFFLLLQKP